MLFSEYVAALSEVELLSPAEEAALWRACKLEGDLQARARLIESYQPLVCREAQPFRARPDVMDAVQEWPSACMRYTASGGASWIFSGVRAGLILPAWIR